MPQAIEADLPPVGTDEAPIPLVVDVDGTLVRSDLLHECALQFLAHRPLEAWRLPLWWAQGKARLKAELAARVDLPVDSLPLRSETLAAIHAAQRDGRPVHLASAADGTLVDALAARLGGIAGVFASGDGINLAGKAKAARLRAAFGAGGFDYIGDRAVDFAVWGDARRVLAVSHGAGFTRRLMRAHPAAEVISTERLRPAAVLRAMRPHQWAKNLLVLIPLFAGHHFTPEWAVATVIAFVCFCLAASSAYLVNDLLDLPADRAHHRKRHRPLASGDLPIAAAVALAGGLMILAFALAALLPLGFVGVLAAYVATTLAYSLLLKRRVLIDVVTLGGLYTMRVLGGVAATGAGVSPWLLMFSLFLFLALAIVKRCSELVVLRRQGIDEVAGRGYLVDDLSVLFSLGAAAGFGATLVIALYLNGTPEVQALYRHPGRLWLLCPIVIYWISRMLFLANRDQLHDDPLVFALTDRNSWLCGALAALVVAAAI